MQPQHARQPPCLCATNIMKVVLLLDLMLTGLFPRLCCRHFLEDPGCNFLFSPSSTAQIKCVAKDSPKGQVAGSSPPLRICCALRRPIFRLACTSKHDFRLDVNLDSVHTLALESRTLLHRDQHHHIFYILYFDYSVSWSVHTSGNSCTEEAYPCMGEPLYCFVHQVCIWWLVENPDLKSE